MDSTAWRSRAVIGFAEKNAHDTSRPWRTNLERRCIFLVTRLVVKSHPAASTFGLVVNMHCLCQGPSCTVSSNAATFAARRTKVRCSRSHRQDTKKEKAALLQALPCLRSNHGGPFFCAIRCLLKPHLYRRFDLHRETFSYSHLYCI